MTEAGNSMPTTWSSWRSTIGHQTVLTILAQRFGRPEATYEHGVVWRTKWNALTEAEVRQRLRKLPCVFTGAGLDIESLENARTSGWFTFKALEYHPLPRASM
jgi:hypothetical protein